MDKSLIKESVSAVPNQYQTVQKRRSSWCNLKHPSRKDLEKLISEVSTTPDSGVWTELVDY